MAIIIVSFYFVEDQDVRFYISCGTSFVYLLILSFFRKPVRDPMIQDNAIISAADGKVVVIEETEETECLKQKCIQVSVFMNIDNVHINWYPVNGKIRYVKHHSGNFKRAYLPKSSEMNEHTTIMIERPDGRCIVMKQIAGAIARRIVTYAEEGTRAVQSDEAGFIKFGSRVDLFLPLDTEIKVKIGDRTIGSQTVIGVFSNIFKK